MNGLLARVIDAHGGMKRWNDYEKVEATMVSGGAQESNPRRMTVWLHDQRSSVCHMGPPISARCSQQRGSLSRSWMARS